MTSCSTFGQKYRHRANFCSNSMSRTESTCRKYAREYVKKYMSGLKRDHVRNEQYSKCMKTCNSIVQVAGFSLAQVLPVLCLLVLMIGLGISYKRSKQRTRSTTQDFGDDRRNEMLITTSSTV